MVTIKFLKKDPRIMQSKDYKYVGKECVVAEWMAHSMVRTGKRQFPDALVNVEIDFTQPFPRYNGERLQGKRVLVYRNGGAGDLIMLTPAIAKLKKLYPTATFDLITQSKFHSLCRMLPPFDSIGEFPIIRDDANYDYYISFAGSIEDPTFQARNIPGIDLFANCAKVKLDESEKLFDFMSSNKTQRRAKKIVNKNLDNKKNKIVAIQFRPTNINRAFDVMKMAKIIGALAEAPNIDIFILGGDERECMFSWEEDGKPHPRVHKLLGKTTWGETVEIVKMADLCIGADSSLIHIAGMCRTPSIGIYGPIPWELRTIDYPECQPVWADYECAPCFCHGERPCTPLVKALQKYKEENEKNPAWFAAPCWDAVDENIIIDKAINMLYPEESLEHYKPEVIG